MIEFIVPEGESEKDRGQLISNLTGKASVIILVISILSFLNMVGKITFLTLLTGVGVPALCALHGYIMFLIDKLHDPNYKVPKWLRILGE